MSTIKIGKYNIGSGFPCFIIAEAGVNHNGDINIAKKLIKEAKESGADCVKFQTFKSERVITKNAPKAKYQLETTDPSESQLEMLKKLELPNEYYPELIHYCNEHDIMFLSTPYNKEDVDFLDDIGVQAFKLASIHVAEPAFVKYAAEKGKPIILSTGMATLGEIDKAVYHALKTKNNNLILLQCTTNYPSRLKDANLLAMQTISKSFHLNVGYSDHTKSDIACIASVALGAKVIEKHFTIDKSLPGPDQSSSSDPSEFKQLVENIRNCERVLGSPIKSPSEIEKINLKGMRRSIVIKNNIKKGTLITEDMLEFKRPSSGISPSMLDLVVGRKAVRDLFEDDLIDFSDIS
tara:strand:- start:24773 stop:25822 length:1050 start_codon:yes stop_codon:yes gene_type:complete